MKWTAMVLVALAINQPALAATLNTNKVMASAKANVARDLKDPASAQFRDVKVVMSTSEKDPKQKIYAVCGEVNAKNSFGGYVGYQRFVAAVTADLQDTALATVEPTLVESLWRNWCLTDKEKSDARKAAEASRAIDRNSLGACDAQAGDRLGNERESFLKECMQSFTEARLKACNTEVGSRAGDARKEFMADCLTRN